METPNELKGKESLKKQIIYSDYYDIIQLKGLELQKQMGITNKMIKSESYQSDLDIYTKQMMSFLGGPTRDRLRKKLAQKQKEKNTN